MTERYTQADGQRLFDEDRQAALADPELQAAYREEFERKALWLQLVEARQAVGLTQAELGRRLGVSQAQVARMEKAGYDAYTLTTLRRFVNALGGDFELVAAVRRRRPRASASVPR